MTRWTVLALVGFGLLAACGSKPATDTQTVARLSDMHFLGAPVAVSNLTVWPVFTDKPLEIGNFLTLQEAQEQKLAVVREAGGGAAQRTAVANDANGQQRERPAQGQRRVSREQVDRLVQELAEENGQSERQVQVVVQELSGATVGQLVIENKGDLPILVCAGTVVTGGKQDRQIGQDFVIQAHSTVPVDAFCVEQGRWTASRGGVATNGRFEVAEYVAMKNVRLKGQVEKDQSGVWQEVASVNAARATPQRDVAAAGATNFGAQTLQDTDNDGIPDMGVRVAQGSSLAVGWEAVSEEAKQQDDAIAKTVREHFAAAGKGDARLIGFAYAIDGKPVSVRTFAHKRIFDGQFGAFVRTMCVEADVARKAAKKKGAEPVTKPARAEDLVALVRSIDEAEETIDKTRAGNDNGYKKAERGYNSNCYFKLDVNGDGKLVPVALTQDWSAK